jgi:hypothetical protein
VNIKCCDWWIAGIITALVLMAEYRLVFYGVFEPFPVSASIALPLLSRSVHQHAPRIITKQSRSRIRGKSNRL